MNSDRIYNKRRYLAEFNTRNLPQMFTDCLVIGAGIAGLRAAIEAGNFGSVMLLTKNEELESNSSYAQGGIAVVLQRDKTDSPETHIADTLKVGCGLNDKQAVETVITQGSLRVEELIEWGANFDRKDGNLELGKEAGHTTNRILHAQGDTTGRELVRALLAKVKTCKNVNFQTHSFVVDLLTQNDQCLGALVYDKIIGLKVIWAKQTILATGGSGRVYQETTNPKIATGDGHAIAWRAGVTLQDMEMMQFHPTTLYVAGASRALISEAVRGEGAYLVDGNGKRFMQDYHPDLELAPRDVVSRSIIDFIAKNKTRYVFLDARHIKNFAQRFPYITKLCKTFDIDVTKDLIPVRPSAHYMIGGAKIDLNAKTNIENLYACGEVASSGLHGANRLASNSLLEGLVFGQIAGENAGKYIKENPAPALPVEIESPKITDKDSANHLDISDFRQSLRSTMWRLVAIQRQKDRLEKAQNSIEFWGRYILTKTFKNPFGWESQNMLTIAWLTTQAALQRTESRGVHYREDYPDLDENWSKHITQQIK